MRSSTSSSERIAPPGPWGRTWLLAAVLAIAGLAAVEWSLRASHHHPNVSDDPMMWALARRRATGDAIAIVGTSRIQLAFSSAEFAAAAGRTPVNLAIDGASAPPILEDLAADPDFHGVAICDLAEWEVDRAELDATVRTELAHHLWRAPGAATNRILATLAQQRLVALGIGGRYVLASALDGAWPPPSWLETLPDRDRRGDYRHQPETRLALRRARNRDHMPTSAPDPEAWLAATARLVRAAEAIHARGGTVVFVRMPLAGEVRAIADRVYPRARYWDRFAVMVTAIHADDVAAWASLAPPDDVHLDRRDQARFTSALVEALHARGVL